VREAALAILTAWTALLLLPIALDGGEGRDADVQMSPSSGVRGEGWDGTAGGGRRRWRAGVTTFGEGEEGASAREGEERGEERASVREREPKPRLCCS